MILDAQGKPDKIFTAVFYAFIECDNLDSTEKPADLFWLAKMRVVDLIEQVQREWLRKKRIRRQNKAHKRGKKSGQAQRR
jgi:hypothetical protein